jgi:putative transposase
MARRMVAALHRNGWMINRKRVRRLMCVMRIEAIYQKPNTSRAHRDHIACPHLLRGMAIHRLNQVWCADITHIPVTKGFVYLIEAMDWFGRRVLARRLSTSMETEFGTESLGRRWPNRGARRCLTLTRPSSSPAQNSPTCWRQGAYASAMDGKGRYLDNIFIERLWRSLKYEDI